MFTLKDAMAADVHSTFFNLNEFAEEALINDVLMPIVKDDLALEKYNLNADGVELARGELLFYAPADRFIKKPFKGMAVMIDKKKYSAVKVSFDGFTYEIVLAGYRS